MKLGVTARRLLLAAASVAGAIAFLALCALTVLPSVVPVEELRDTAAEAVSRSTGQMAQFDSDPVLRVFPTPRVVVGKLVFPLPGGGALDAEGAVAHLRILPLIFGRVEVADVTLRRPTLALTGEVSLPPLSVAALVAGSDLPELQIVDGTVAWRTGEGLTEELVSGINARLDRSSDGRGLSAALAFVWREARVVGSLDLDDAKAFLGGNPTDVRMSVSSEGSRLRFKGTAASGTEPTAEGELTMDTPALRTLLAWVGTSAPTTGGFGPFQCSTHLVLRNGEVALTDATVELDGNRSEGGLIVKVVDGRPLVQGTFAADEINITQYGRVMLTRNGGREWDRRPIDLAPLHTADLDLRFSASRVKAGDSAFSSVATSAVLRGGRLAVALGNAQGWGGGQLRASVTLGQVPGSTSADVRIDADATDVKLDRALDDVAGIRRLDGTGTLSLSLQGRGTSVQALADDISGALSVSGAAGAILGFDAAQVLQRIERRPLSYSSDMRGGRTAYDKLVAKVAISKGIATVEQLRIDGKQVQLSMEGTVAVGDRDLDLKGKASLISTQANGGFDLPFIVQGRWDNPLLLPDPQSLIQRSGAAQPLLESVRGRVGDAAVRSVIEHLGKPAAN